jgi:alpha-L-rhamnosidase
MRRLLFLLLLLTAPLLAQGPVDLKCENAVNPKGIKAAHPQLSWAMNTALTLHGYHILVASSEEKLAANEGDLWDSGRVMTYKNKVEYKGKPLGSLQKCYWKVRVFGNYWSPTLYSEPATFQMAGMPYVDPEKK